MSKNILRKKILLNRRKKFNLVNLKYNSFKKILKKSNLLRIKSIGAYYPINYEIDCLQILKKLEQSGLSISLPVVKKNCQMDFFQWSFDQPLRVGRMSVPEPFANKKVYPDVLIVPLVAFDKFKYRLGYGGGYYDRYIQRLSKIKNFLSIGFAFSYQKIEKLPVNNYDKKLDFILTEKYIL